MEEGSASVGLGLRRHGSAHRVCFQRRPSVRQFRQQGMGVRLEKGTLQAQGGDKGGAQTEAASFSKSTEIYQLGKNGLMAAGNRCRHEVLEGQGPQRPAPRPRSTGTNSRHRPRSSAA